MDEAGKVVASGSEEHENFSVPSRAGRNRIRGTGGGPAESPFARRCSLPICDADDIACVGFSGQMHGAVLLDSADEVVRSAIIWCDQRSEAQSHELEEIVRPRHADSAHLQSSADQFHADEISLGARDRTGKLGTGRARHAAERLRALPSHRGTAIDMADASGTLLLDVTNRRWSAEVLSKTGIDEGLLPRSVRIARGLRQSFGCRCGSHRPEGGTPVVAGAGDQAAGPSAWASPAPARSAQPSELPAWCLPRPIVPRWIPRTVSYFLPRDSWTLARHGRDAGGGILSALVSRSIRGGIVPECRRKMAAIRTTSSPKKPAQRPLALRARSGRPI